MLISFFPWYLPLTLEQIPEKKVFHKFVYKIMVVELQYCIKSAVKCTFGTNERMWKTSFLDSK